MANNQPTIEQVRRVRCPECDAGPGAPCLEYGTWGTRGRHLSKRARKHHHIERVLACKGVRTPITPTSSEES